MISLYMFSTDSSCQLMFILTCFVFFFFFKQKTAYEMRISDWSSDVCSSDLLQFLHFLADRGAPPGRTGRGGAGALREHAGPADPCRTPVRGHRLRHRRIMGQLSADLFACRVAQDRPRVV